MIRREWSLSLSSDYLRRLGIRLAHRDGAVGTLLALGKSPRKVRIEFDDGIVTEQHARDLHFTDGEELSNYTFSQPTIKLYDLKLILNKVDPEGQWDIPALDIEALFSIWRKRIHFTSKILNEETPKSSIIALLTFYRALEATSRLDTKMFAFCLSEIKEAELCSDLEALFNDQIYAHIIAKIFCNVEQDISLLSFYRSITRCSAEFIDNHFIQTALRVKFARLLSNECFDAAKLLYKHNTTLFDRQWVCRKKTYYLHKTIRKRSSKICSLIQGCNLESAKKENEYLQKLNEGVGGKARELIRECEVLEQRLELGRVESISKESTHLIFPESRDYFIKRIENLSSEVRARFNKAIKISPMQARLLVEKYNFLPISDELEVELIDSYSQSLERLQTRLQRAISDTLECHANRVKETLTQISIETEFTARDLDLDSEKLVLKWANVNFNLLPDLLDYLRNADKSICWELCRLCSARQAEIAAIEFFDGLGEQVRDISIQQVKSTSKIDWITHDLETESGFYDVKNARKSFASKSNFSEFCVPNFKRNRSQDSVKILGVLSDYQTIDNLINRERSRCRVLGSVSIEDLILFGKILFRASRGSLKFDSFGPTERTEKFIPGWIYDYPSALYEQRDKCIEKLPALLEAWHHVHGNYSGIPLSVIFLHHIHSPEPTYSALGNVPEWSGPLKYLLVNCGLSLRSIVGGILAICINEASRHNSSFASRDLHQVIFLEGDKKHPLFVYDPLEYARNFIDIFDSIFETCKYKIADLESYRLSGEGILQGRTIDGFWQTIIAYCGGWNHDRNVKCGKNPIHCASADHCSSSECGKLICPDCGFCSNFCNECKIRQENWPPLSAF